MRFEDERYVRKYTRKTVTHRKLGWEGRAVWDALLGEFDRAGLVDLSGEDPVDAVHMLTEIPLEIVELGLRRLFDTGTIRLLPNQIFAPRFMEAQQAQQSDRARQQASRERARAKARYDSALQASGSDSVTGRDIDHTSDPDASHGKDVTGRDTDPRDDFSDTGSEPPDVTGRDDGSRDVTICHDLSQPVTPSLAVPSSTSRIHLSGSSETGEVDPTRSPSALFAGARARTREGESDRATSRLANSSHPDRGFTNTVTPVAIETYEPSGYVLQDAKQAGLGFETIQLVLADYRRGGRLREGSQAEHDKRFGAFVAEAARKNGGRDEKHERSERRNSRAPAAAANGANGSDGQAGGRQWDARTQRSIERAERFVAKYNPTGKAKRS